MCSEKVLANEPYLNIFRDYISFGPDGDEGYFEITTRSHGNENSFNDWLNKAVAPMSNSWLNNAVQHSYFDNSD